MNANLMSGLMAGANFGTGFFSGQDQQQQAMAQRQQMALQGQQAAMVMLMNRMKLQDEQRNLGFQQDEGAYARQLATDPDTADLPMDQKLDLLTKNALSKGDLVRANEFAVNATNFRNAQVLQDQKKQAISRGMMESQQKLHQYMGSELAAAAEEGPEAFEQARMLALFSGHGTPEDQQRLANLQWQPGLADKLRLGAMTSRQQAQTLLEQQRLQQTKKNQDLLERNREIRQQLNAQKLRDAEDLTATKAKAGGGQKAPTQNELDQTIPLLKDSGLDPKSPDFSQAQQALVSTKKALQKANPNLPDAQALQQAAAMVGKQDVQTLTVPKSGFFGSETTKKVYKMAGATPKDPIPYTGDKASLIPGRYYTTGSHGVVQFTGTGFVPVQ